MPCPDCRKPDEKDRCRDCRVKHLNLHRDIYLFFFGDSVTTGKCAVCTRITRQCSWANVCPECLPHLTAMIAPRKGEITIYVICRIFDLLAFSYDAFEGPFCPCDSCAHLDMSIPVVALFSRCAMLDREARKGEPVCHTCATNKATVRMEPCRHELACAHCWLVWRAQPNTHDDCWLCGCQWSSISFRQQYEKCSFFVL